MTIELQWGIPSDKYLQAAAIIYDSFEMKFRFTFGPHEKAIPFIASQLNGKFALVALKDERILGLAGSKTKQGELVAIKAGAFLRTYHVRSIRTLILTLPFLVNRIQPGVLELNTLSVTKSARGHGVGTKLIQEIIRYAASKGFYWVELEVVKENIQAKALYERLGFQTVNYQQIPRPWSFFLGFTGVYTMRYGLP